MKDDDVWVSPSDSGWRVRREGAGKAAGIFDTQAEAIEHGRDMAKRNRSELFIQDRHGRIRERDSHGHDPRKTKG